MNIRELSVGSFVRVNLGRYGLLTGMVGEIGRRQMGVFIIEKTLFLPVSGGLPSGNCIISSIRVLRGLPLTCSV